MCRGRKANGIFVSSKSAIQGAIRTVQIGERTFLEEKSESMVSKPTKISQARVRLADGFGTDRRLLGLAWKKIS